MLKSAWFAEQLDKLIFCRSIARFLLEFPWLFLHFWQKGQTIEIIHGLLINYYRWLVIKPKSNSIIDFMKSLIHFTDQLIFYTICSIIFQPIFSIVEDNYKKVNEFIIKKFIINWKKHCNRIISIRFPLTNWKYSIKHKVYRITIIDNLVAI